MCLCVCWWESEWEWCLLLLLLLEGGQRYGSLCVCVCLFHKEGFNIGRRPGATEEGGCVGMGVGVWMWLCEYVCVGVDGSKGWRAGKRNT